MVVAIPKLVSDWCFLWKYEQVPVDSGTFLFLFGVFVAMVDQSVLLMVLSIFNPRLFRMFYRWLGCILPVLLMTRVVDSLRWTYSITTVSCMQCRTLAVVLGCLCIPKTKHNVFQEKNKPEIQRIKCSFIVWSNRKKLGCQLLATRYTSGNGIFGPTSTIHSMIVGINRNGKDSDLAHYLWIWYYWVGCACFTVLFTSILLQLRVVLWLHYRMPWNISYTKVSSREVRSVPTTCYSVKDMQATLRNWVV